MGSQRQVVDRIPVHVGYGDLTEGVDRRGRRVMRPDAQFDEIDHRREESRAHAVGDDRVVMLRVAWFALDRREHAIDVT